MCASTFSGGRDLKIFRRFCFGKVIPRGDASRKVGSIAAIPGAGLLVNHKIIHDLSMIPQAPPKKLFSRGHTDAFR